MAISRGKLKEESCERNLRQCQFILHKSQNSPPWVERPQPDRHVNVAMLRQAILIQGDSLVKGNKINNYTSRNTFVDENDNWREYSSIHAEIIVLQKVLKLFASTWRRKPTRRSSVATLAAGIATIGTSREDRHRRSLL